MAEFKRKETSSVGDQDHEYLYPFPAIDILPELKKEQGGQIVTVNVIGPPDSGKTSIINALTSKPFEGMNMLGVSEFGDWGNRVYQRIKPDLSSGKPRHLTLDWISPEIELMKAIAFLDAIAQVRGSGNYPALVVQEGGVHDGIVKLEYARLLTKNKDNLFDGFEDEDDLILEPEKTVRPGFSKVYGETLVELYKIAHDVNAVILVVNTLEKAKENRIKQGLTTEGIYTNEDNWPRLMTAYTAWLLYLFPLFRSRVGTGLKIVDSSKPLDDVTSEVREYLERVVN